MPDIDIDKEATVVKTSVSQLRKQGVEIQEINESQDNKHYSYSESGYIKELYESLGKPAGRAVRMKPESNYWISTTTS